MGWIAAKFPKDKQVLAFSGADPAAYEDGLTALVGSAGMTPVGGKNGDTAASTAVMLEQGEAAAAAALTAAGAGLPPAPPEAGQTPSAVAADTAGPAPLEEDGVMGSGNGSGSGEEMVAGEEEEVCDRSAAAVVAVAGGSGGGGGGEKKRGRETTAEAAETPPPPPAAPAAHPTSSPILTGPPRPAVGTRITVGGGSMWPLNSATASSSARDRDRKASPIRTLGMMREESARRAQGLGTAYGNHGLGIVTARAGGRSRTGATTTTMGSGSPPSFLRGPKGTVGRATSVGSGGSSTASMSSAETNLRAKVRSSTENDMYGAWCAY